MWPAEEHTNRLRERMSGNSFFFHLEYVLFFIQRRTRKILYYNDRFAHIQMHCAYTILRIDMLASWNLIIYCSGYIYEHIPYDFLFTGLIFPLTFACYIIYMQHIARRAYRLTWLNTFIALCHNIIKRWNKVIRKLRMVFWVGWRRPHQQFM